MLQYTNLFGETKDKVQTAIAIARMFEPKTEPYILAYSGGKDSTCVKHILDMAGVKYDTVYNVTTVDPKPLVQHIISQFKYVIYDYHDGTHKYFKVSDNNKLKRIEESEVEQDGVIHFTIPQFNMKQLIIKNGYPPTRLARYCCKELKENTNKGRITVTGSRRHESANRKQNSGDAVIFDGKIAQEAANMYGTDVKKVNRGGVVLNYDDSDSRKIVEHCYRTAKVIVNPIADFAEDDVWDCIHQYNLPYCKLYDEGWKRLGCLGCPMGNTRIQEFQFEKYPHIKRYYLNAFDAMLKERERKGLVNRCHWNNAEDVMRWWLGYDKKSNPNQIDIEELLE